MLKQLIVERAHSLTEAQLEDVRAYLVEQASVGCTRVPGVERAAVAFAADPARWYWPSAEKIEAAVLPPCRCPSCGARKVLGFA